MQVGSQASAPQPRRCGQCGRCLGRKLARPCPRVNETGPSVPLSLPLSWGTWSHSRPFYPEPKKPPAGLPHCSPLSGSEIPILIYLYHSNTSIAFSECICWPVIRCPRGTAQLPGTVPGDGCRDGEAWPRLKGAQSCKYTACENTSRAPWVLRAGVVGGVRRGLGRAS